MRWALYYNHGILIILYGRHHVSRAAIEPEVPPLRTCKTTGVGSVIPQDYDSIIICHAGRPAATTGRRKFYPVITYIIYYNNLYYKSCGQAYDYKADVWALGVLVSSGTRILYHYYSEYINIIICNNIL
jgi:hypothetical protein